MANYPFQNTMLIGPAAPATSTVSNGLNNAAYWQAVRFWAPVTSTLNNVRAYMSATNGTLTGSDCTLDVFSNSVSGSNAQPNASVAGPYSCDSSPSGAGWYEWTPSYSVTRGTMYWLVFKNADGTPATNYPTFGGILTNAGCNLSTGNTFYGSANTTNSGATWSTSFLYGFRVGFSDGSFLGIPFTTGAVLGVSYGVYSTREAGVVFTSPADADINAIGAYVSTGAAVGSPTGSQRVRLYTGTTLRATTGVVGKTSNGAYGYFDSPYTVPAGSTVRVVLSETTQSDTSSNYYQIFGSTFDSDADSAGLVPFGARATYYDGSSWTDSTTQAAFGGLIADMGDPFYVAAGGGVRFPRTFTGF